MTAAVLRRGGLPESFWTKQSVRLRRNPNYLKTGSGFALNCIRSRLFSYISQGFFGCSSVSSASRRCSHSRSLASISRISWRIFLERRDMAIMAAARITTASGRIRPFKNSTVTPPFRPHRSHSYRRRRMSNLSKTIVSHGLLDYKSVFRKIYPD